MNVSLRLMKIADYDEMFELWIELCRYRFK
jgi:hypothetical protein